MSSICVPHCVDQAERQQWNYVFNNWSIDTIYLLCDVNFDDDTWSSHALLRLKTVQLIKSISEISEPLVLITSKTSSIIKGEIDLSTYIHPNNCCYMFGNNDNTEFKETIVGDKVYIETLNELYNWSSACIVFYDRMVKSGN